MVHRGRRHYVRLLAGAGNGFCGALAGVAVDDPNDQGVKVVELSAMEYIILRACTLNEDAVDAEFHLYAVTAIALSRVDAAMNRCGFDYTTASLSVLAQRADALVIPEAEVANFCLALNDFFQLQDDDDPDSDDPDLQQYPLGTEQVTLSDLVDPYTLRLSPMAELCMLVRYRILAVDRQAARSRFRTTMSACFKAAASFADDRDPDAEDFRAHLGQWLVASTFPAELMQAPVELSMARADIRNRLDLAKDNVLKVIRERWSLFLAHFTHLSALLGAVSSPHMGVTLAQQLAVGLELTELKTVAHFHNLELQAGKYIYTLAVGTAAGQPQHLDAAARVAALVAEYERAQRRTTTIPSSSAAPSLPSSSSRGGSGGSVATLAGAFHTSNSLAFNRWLAANKSTMATALTDSLASGCSKRVLRKALGLQQLAVMQFLLSKISSPIDDLFSKLLMHRSHLRQYISFTLSTPAPSLSARLQFQASRAAVAVTDPRLQNAEQALEAQGIVIPKALLDYEINLDLLDNFISGKWHSHCDFYNDGARAMALKAAGGAECALPPLAWPFEVCSSKAALMEVQRFGDSLLNCIGYPKEDELGWHGLFGEALSAVGTGPISATSGARLWNIVRPQLERAAGRFDLARMGDAEFGFPRFSTEADPFFRAIAELKTDGQYTAHLFQQFEHLRPPASMSTQAQLSAAAGIVDGTAAAAARAAQAATDKAKAAAAKRKAEQDARALKRKKKLEADGDAKPPPPGKLLVDGHAPNVTIGSMASQVEVSGDTLTVNYKPNQRNGTKPVVTIKKSMSKMDTELAAAGEHPNVCKPCYLLASPTRLMYCNNPQHADHATATSPAHVWKLGAEARRALCDKCGV